MQFKAIQHVQSQEENIVQALKPDLTTNNDDDDTRIIKKVG